MAAESAYHMSLVSIAGLMSGLNRRQTAMQQPNGTLKTQNRSVKLRPHPHVTHEQTMSLTWR